MKKYSWVICSLLLTACAVGPDYKKPDIATPAYKEIPKKYKETPPGWKYAQPRDNCNRGEWWKIFCDPQLNALEANLNISNQNIAVAQAQYRQARALVDQARANYFPTVGASFSITRANQILFNSSGAGTTAGTSGSTVTAGAASTGGASSGPFTSEFLLLNASWEPDIWGAVRRTVEASEAGAQASDAQLALTRLSAQASLAQYYFELRALDRDQQLLDDTVRNYKKTLVLTQHQYTSGVVSRSDVIQAQSQLETTQAQAINNGILRSQYEHAIAVLIGKPPAEFGLKFKPLTMHAPTIPLQFPSTLLERRPDIAQAERLMAQANAQIGIAISAYFPDLTLNASGSLGTRGPLNSIFDNPGFGWSLGPQLTGTLYDGGLRDASVRAARANYDATVASYRQTVLAAFQDVEDNLVALKKIKQQSAALNQAAEDARRALRLVMNQYKAGTVPYSSVITAQTTAYTAEKSAADVVGLEMTSTVGLIKALGGGWVKKD